VFTLRGVGTVITGTLTGGVLRKGHQVIIQPGKTQTRIRSVQSHNKEVETSPPGTRTALNLPDVSISEDSQHSGVQRGDTITLPNLGGSHKVADVLLEKSARLTNASTPAATPFKDGTRVRIHHSSANYAARVILASPEPLGPGEQRVAQLRFESPAFMFAGDRFIVRDWSEQWTLAGGLVLDPDATSRGFRSPAHRQFLEARAKAPGELRAFILSLLKRDRAVKRAPMLVKSRFSSDEISTALSVLSTEKVVVCDRDWALAAEWWNTVKSKAAEAIRAEHRAHPDRPGLALNELRSIADLPDQALFDLLVADLCRNGFAQSGTAIRHSQHRLALPPQLQSHGARLRNALAAKPFEPPTRKDLASDAASQQALRFLIQSGEAIELDADTVMLAEQYAKATQLIRSHLQKTSGATASELRQLLNTNRRVIIPLLERLDREGVTVRQGDKRVLKVAK
jgi:selenocysteine-specific elongation factor